MKSVKAIASVSVSMLVVTAWLSFSVEGQSSQVDRFRHNGSIRSENGSDRNRARFTEAPAGFDNLTNGFDVQGPDYETLDDDTVVPLASFNDNRFIFEEREGPADGLGPTYNGTSCGECHQNVVTGGASQVAEHRTGHMAENVFVESLGGSLIASRATHPNIVELVDYRDDVRTLRISTNTLGSGYIEAIANDTLLAIRDAQPADLRGTAIMVPVLEGDGTARIGRFGWKGQHASLVSFAADAYLNEMGITTPLFPVENTSLAVLWVMARHTMPSQILRMMARMSSLSPILCVPQKRLHVDRLTTLSIVENNCLRKSDARRATWGPSRPRLQARRSIAARLRFPRL